MNRHLTASISCAALLSACAAPPPGRAPEQLQASVPPAASPPSTAPVAIIPPLTLEGYKKALAQRIASLSEQTYSDPVPEVLKSIVVLEITIDRDGRLVRVAVRRSNGYKELENRAMDSVRRAAPFAAPAFTGRGRQGSVNFLETFLFRDDGRFQIRSLVAAR